MELDTRFLTVHPRTKLWWEQRQQCAQCTHVRITEGKTHGGDVHTMYHCRMHREGSVWSSCMTARDEGQPCGPDGKLFKESTCTATTGSAK